MIKNYIKTAVRNLWNNKAYSTINIVGLAVGLASVLIIALWVQHQFRYDNFYNQQESIYKLRLKTSSSNSINVGEITSAPVAPLLQEEYPEVEAAARMYWSSDKLISYESRSVKSSGNQVDPSFLEIFDFKLLNGAMGNALDNPNSIVITASLAESLFGNEDPINRTIILDTDQPYTITAVLEDLPTYTDFDFTYLIPLTHTDTYGADWGTNSYFTFVRLRPDTDIDVLNSKIEGIVRKHDPELKSHQLFLYPMSKQHLFSRFENGVAVGGKIEEVRVVGFIGVLILVIAAINFVNLSTARGQKRAREVGVRKVIGASRAGLVAQFILESVLLSFLAGLFAVILVWLANPLFNQVMNVPLSLQWTNGALWLFLFIAIFTTGVLAGLYPALFLSRYAPIRTIRGSVAKGKHFTFREVLVVFQFGIAIILMVATVTVHMHINHAQKRDLGYDNAQLLEIPLEGDASKHYEAIKTALLQGGWASSVARTGWSVTSDAASAGGNFSWEGATPEQIWDTSFRLFRVESDFVNTMGLTLVYGRDLDYARFPADSNSVLINEAAVKAMGMENPVGQNIKWGEDSYTVAGVFNDFIIGSPYEPIKPMFVYPSKNYLSNMIIKTEGHIPIQESLQAIADVMEKFNPAYPFEYHFVDDRFARKFSDQQQTARLAMIFSVLAICISGLGLLGLVAYIAETRTKEIGIRKVLGASVSGIVAMLSKDFVKLVCLAIVIASPIAWWAMNQWLADFAYRIDIQWWMFALAGMVAVVIALLTVATQAIRAAVANPVDSLRDE